MKKLLLFLVLAVTLNISAQTTTYFAKPLELNAVPASVTKSDSVLVRGADKIIKNVPRSEFGVSDSNTSTKGVVKLAGDLGGTADFPTTPTAIHITGNEIKTGSLEATSFIKTGSSQDGFQMGNGSDKKMDLDKVINLSPHAFASNFLENKNIEKSISLNVQRNIFLNSETYTGGNFVSVGTGMTVDNTDTFLYKGIKLVRFKGTAYQSNITLRQSILTEGKRYILSFYVKNNNPQTTTNRFIWFNTSGTASSGQGARFVDNDIRRVSYMFQAAGAQGVYVNNVPTEPIGTGVTGFLTLGVSKTIVAPYVDLYIGGFQIEEVPNTYVDGVVWMGDSTIQSNSGNINAYNSVAIPRFFEGVFNCTSYNVAVAGETMAQMDARWATSVTPLKPNSKYVVIQGGINDISQGRSLSDMQASLNSMNTKALADGFIPVFLTCTPNGSFSVSEETLRNDYNLWLKTNFKKVIDINAIVEQDSKIIVATPNNLFDNDGIHYGVTIKKAIAEFIAKSGFFEFLQPTDYQATTASYTGKDASVRNISAAQITTTLTPITSPGLYDLKTRNQTTGVEEKVPSNTYALNILTGFTPATGTINPTDTMLQGMQKNAGNLAAVISGLPTSGTYTPVCSSNVNFSGGVVDKLAVWTRIGNVVNVKFDFIASVTTAGVDSSISVSLPFTVATGDHQYIGSGVASMTPYSNCFIQALSGQTVCTLYSVPSVTTSARYVGNITYIAAP